MDLTLVRVRDDYRTQYTHPIGFTAGDRVHVGRHDTEWPAFVWVETRDGNAGWAPHAWLRERGEGSAEALRDYSARELDVDAGEYVTLNFELGGWWWVTHSVGQAGWLPARVLELPPSPSLSQESA